MSRLNKAVLYLLIIVGAYLMVAPFLYMVSTAFTRFTYVLPFPPRLIPEDPTVENFVRAWASNNFQRYALNSLLVSIVSMVLTITLSSLTAYAFARFKFPAKEFLFRVLLFSMMVPGMVSIIPMFTIVNRLGLIDSYWGLWASYVSGGLAFNTFLLRGFFEQIPRELEEAVLIDGGGRWTIYRHVILPLSKPALATVCIFSFLGAWDEFFWALTIIKNPDLRTLPIAIALFKNQHATNWGLVFSASLIAVVPVILLFVFFQRYFIQGLTSGATKG